MPTIHRMRELITAGAGAIDTGGGHVSHERHGPTARKTEKPARFERGRMGADIAPLRRA